jgi:hypothetical protein
MGKYFEKLQKGELEEVIKNKKVESEMEEGNAFTGALAKAKEAGKDEFKFNGKTYKVKESETKGHLCRDESLEGVRYYENLIIKWV